MSTGLFTVAVRDLESGHKILRSRVPAEWLRSILADTDVEPFGDKEGEISLTLSKTGVEVLVRGHLDLTVSLPCARTLDPAVYRIRPEIFLLLSQAPGGTSHRAQRARPPREVRVARDGGGEKAAKTAAPHAAPAKGAGKGGKPKGAWDEDPELLDQDAARDTFSGDVIVLDDFLREFILLEVPMVPLREDLRSLSDEASPSPPGSSALPAEAAADPDGPSEKPLDPRLSPLAELKARLEKKKE